MRSWKTTRIGQLGAIITGKTPSSDNPEHFGNEIPFITPSDIPATQKYIKVERHLSERGADAHRKILLPKKSTCVVCIGATIGKTCMTNQVSASNQQINSIVPGADFDPDFVYYISTILKGTLVSFAGGAATPIVNKSAFSSIKVQTPEPAVQRKIAAILTAYDELIENNKRRIALLEKMAEEIYREWFVRMRFPGYQTTKFVKGIPANWHPTPSSQVFDVLSGGTPDTENALYWDGGIPFFTPRDANERFYVLRTEKTLSESGLENCNSQLYPKDTIFITARGTVGKLALADKPMAMNQSCYALRPKLRGGVYFYFLAIRNAIDYIKGVSKSGVFDNIVIDTFKIVPIFVPPAELILKFNELARPMFKQIGILSESNELLVSGRDILLPRLISGKLSVENLDIQFPPNMKEEALTPTLSHEERGLRRYA